MKLKLTQIAAFGFTMFSIVMFGQDAQKKVFGQNVESVNPHNGLIRCISSEYEKSLQQKNASRATRDQFETWIAPKIEEAKERLMNSRNSNVVVTIPVVVHVIHNGDAVGVNENISKARILSQITVLNQDFRRMLGTPGFNENAIGADIEVEFCMAQVAPDGSATDGIDRVNLNVSNWSTNASVEENLKPNTIWDPTQYFNIWVAQFSTNQSTELGGVLGYAQFPSNSGLGGMAGVPDEEMTDGVIIDWRCFGTADIVSGNYFPDYNKGRTATHEIGHCLGLIHIWGDSGSCSVNGSDSNKDYCPDTPAANQPNFDCLDVYNSCPTASGNDMTENYMDYSNDECMNTFTLNQKARMLTVLQNSPRRASLLTSTVCSLLATPTFGLFENIMLYPNPASDFVTITVPAGLDLPEAYTIYNSLGQTLSVRTVTSSADLTIATSGFSNGIYFVKVSKGGAVKTLRFIKN